MRRNLLLFFLTSIYFFGHTKSELNIINPIGNWGTNSGNIAELTLAMKPQGVYMKYDLYITFALEAGVYPPDDSLEVEFFFHLPVGAMVCDSWLWIEDYISYGIIMDGDSASRIYEGIVNRRTDPSILFKRSETRYELRIFPITANEPRKVKISYLLPMDWTSDYVFAHLPFKEFRDWIIAPQVDLILLEDSIWQNPKVMEYPATSFVPMNDSLFGNYLKAPINGVMIENHLTLGNNSPMEDGIYVSYTPTQSDEGYYQMALLPSEQIAPSPPGKILFLIDYDKDNGEDFRTQMRDNIKQILSPGDSFNVMLKTIHGIDLASQNWLNAHPSTINVLFSPNTFSLSPQSDLFELLKSGYDYINEKNDGGAIVLFSNNDSYHSYFSADSFYTALSNEADISTPLMIGNYQHRGAEFTGYGSFGQWGNDELFKILATESGGRYYSPHGSFMSIYAIFRQTVISAMSQFEDTDVYLNTRTANGVCEDIHQFSPDIHTQSLRSVILQTGKYRGDLPFIAELFFLTGQNFQAFDLIVDQSKMKPIGPNAKKIWVGNDIFSKEKLGYSPTNKQEIRDLSVENRILSIYTAFLCLEDTVHFGMLKRDDTGWVGVEKTLAEDEINIQVYPNPFVKLIQISIKNLSNNQPLGLKLIDIQGKVLHDFPISRTEIVDREVKLEWNAAHLPAGTYILLFDQGTEKRFLRLVKE